ncbi:phosphoglycerate mutase-like protein [Cristinia sonorae]|uniref:Phosphoglycerate mutase-like protein n=1 Tax=Cristinia sonorae TaxID=1940300 RepID=A0A8K0UFP3_9AGAR|nr:phosphoglycerate mutase-like protein [Cristinia sonorae]
MAYSAVSGFFIQDDPAAVPTIIGALPVRLGLIDDSIERWKTFKKKLDQLNAEGDAVYKLVYLCRHGQGYHNVAESKYGTEAWDAYWSTLNGDDELTWGPDPLLTPVGQGQAVDAREAWKAELEFGIPTPERCYASPLRRALDTWTITMGGEGEHRVLPEASRRVTILENCREEYGIHTCDLRSPLSSLQRLYPPPMYTFEDGFREEDPVWREGERETKENIARRALTVLDVIFRGDRDGAIVSITAHGGFINGFLAAIGRPSYALPTGGILPVVVKYAI